MKPYLRHLLAGATLLAACAAQAAGVSVLVLDRDGKPVQDAVVVLVPPGGAKPVQGLASNAIISQERMQFVPAVTIVPVGARVTMTNNDSWEHHVRGSAAGALQFSSSGGFELRLDGKQEGKPAKSADIVLDKAGALLLGCHIHGSMRGYVYVSDSPWALKTGADGVATFDGLPDGATQVRVWHPEQLIDLPARTVTAGATAQKTEFKLQVVPRRRRV